MKINSVIIGVGSNINPVFNVNQAENEIKAIGVLKQKSNFFYTKPLLYKDQNDFLNGVLHIETPYEKSELNKILKSIEFKLGRIRDENKNGPRTIDLDIVIFNNQILDRDVFKRDFFRIPIIEIFPYLLPVLNCENYLNNFDDIQRVIEIIKSELPAEPISIFGAGHWFCDEECTASNIDIIVIVNEIDTQYDTLINMKLKNAQLNTINNHPVQIKLHWLEESEKKSAGNELLADSKRLQKSLIKQMPFYKLLYGQECPITDN